MHDNIWLSWSYKIIIIVCAIIIARREKRRKRERHSLFLRKQEAIDRKSHVEVDKTVRNKKAKLDLIKIDSNPKVFLYHLKNIGYVSAKKVEVVIPELEGKNPGIVCFDYYRMKNFTLQPGFEVEFRIRTTDRSTGSYPMSVTWSDDYGDENIVEVEIDLSEFF